MKILLLIHVDIWTFPIMSVSEIIYDILFLDHFSHFMWFYPFHWKNDTFGKYTFQTICRLSSTARSKHSNVTMVVNLTIDISEKNSHPIEQLSTSHIHTRLVRTLLFQASMSLTYRVEVLHTVVHLLNILSSSTIANKIPFTTFLVSQANYNHLCTFGCHCFSNLLPMTAHKLSQRSIMCVFLGYLTDHRGDRCMNFSYWKIILSSCVTFGEAQFPFSATSSSHALSSASQPFLPPPPISRSIFSSFPNPLLNQSPPSFPPHVPAPSLPLVPHMSQNFHQMTFHSKTGIVKPRIPLWLHTDTISPLPFSHVHAAKDLHWNNVMGDEYHAFIKTTMCTLVPRPHGINVVCSMWLFKHNLNVDGSLSRYKVLLVANWRSQQLGIDCDEMFSQVNKPTSIRTILHVAVAQNWPFHQLDIKKCFALWQSRRYRLHASTSWICSSV